jgi:hypothetical protein
MGTIRAASPDKRRVSFNLPRLLERRQRWTLTWLGWLVLVAVVALTATLAFRGLYAFLAITHPSGAPLLVVEGWMPTFAYREAAARFRDGGYDRLLAVGAFREDGESAADSAEAFGIDALTRFGVPPDRIATASSSAVQVDRTFHSAMAVKAWLASHGLARASIDVATLGPHARRTLVLYEKALGDEARVGVVALADFRIDPQHWWRTSQGARSVIGEAIGYVYARFLFSPAAYRAVAPPGGGNDDAGR